MRTTHLFFGLTIALACALSSCTQYEVKSSGSSYSAIVDITINQSDWQYTNYTEGGQPYANNYFYAQVSVPALTSEFFNNGQVQGFVLYNKNTSSAYQHVLPYVRHLEEVRAGQWNYYTETVDFIYGIGWAEFNYRASDFLYEDDVTIYPNAMDFRLVLTR